MTFNEIIQKAGKQIYKSVYYIIDNERTDVNENNIDTIKFISNNDLLGTAIKGCELTLKEEISGEIYVVIQAKYQTYVANETYGPFTLKEKPTYDANTKTYLHKAYDNIIKSMVPYEPITMAYPCTINAFFTRLVNEIGYDNNIVSLPNGTITMDSDIYTGINFTYRDVLDDIAKANGVLFKIDGNEIKICNFGTTPIVINDDILKNINIEFKNKVGPINSIVLSRAGGSDNVYLQDDESVALNGLHEYKISDNQLMNGNNRSDFLQAILNRLDYIEYYVYDTELIGYGDFEPLDKVQFQTNNNTYNSYIFNDEKTLNTGYSQSIFNQLPEETNTEYKYADKTDRKINQTYLIVDKQNQAIEAVVSTSDELVEKTTQLRLDVDRIEGEIGEIADITISAEGTGSVELEGVNESEPIYIKLTPTNTSIKLLYPLETLYPSDNLYPLDYLTLTFTNTTDSTTRSYTLPCDLLYYNSTIKDEFYLDYENEQCYVIHKVGLDQSGVEYPLQTPTTEYFTPYPTIALTQGDYVVSSSVASVYMFVRLMANNIYTAQFATRVEMNSKITQTASEINLEVAKKINGYDANGNRVDDVISSINLAPGEATIQASKVNINGVIQAINNNTTTTIDGGKITTGTLSADTINGGTLSGSNISIGNGMFSVNAYGQVYAGNGTFNGTINSTNGNIGSATIDGDGIYVGQSEETAGIGKYGSRYAFWAGTNINNTFNAPFRVGHNGELWATNAHISGQIDASSITSGTLNVDRIPNISASKIKAGTVSASKITFNGSSGGYLEVGTDTIHPKVSGLNVSSGGVNIGSGRLILGLDGNYATIRNSLNGVGNILFLDKNGNIIKSDGDPITLYEVLSATSYCMSKGWLKRL